MANIGENTLNYFYDISNCTNPSDITTCAKMPVNYGGTPKNKYKALSLTLTRQKVAGEHVSMQATYRISKIVGNYEGLFRSDNGQQDPNISSLYDFPNSNLTRSQFFSGPLNSDTPHVLRVNMGYDDLLIKNLSAAVTFKWSSGTLRTPYLAHPNYQNAGEIPGNNPQYYKLDTTGPLGVPDGYADFFLLKDYTAVQRGADGRNPDTALWDIKFAYKWNLGKSALDFSVLVQNIFNDTHYDSYDQFVENSTGVTNPSFGQPASAVSPRSIRLGVKWSF